METKEIFSESGIIITLILILIPVVLAFILVITKVQATIKSYLKRKELQKFNKYLTGLSSEETQKLE